MAQLHEHVLKTNALPKFSKFVLFRALLLFTCPELIGEVRDRILEHERLVLDNVEIGSLPGLTGGSRTGIRHVSQNLTLIGKQFRHRTPQSTSSF